MTLSGETEPSFVRTLRNILVGLTRWPAIVPFGEILDDSNDSN